MNDAVQQQYDGEDDVEAFPTLQELALKFMCRNLDILLHKIKEADGNFTLPNAICEKLIKIYQLYGTHVNGAQLAALFADPAKTPLSIVDIFGLPVDAAVLATFSQHNLLAFYARNSMVNLAEACTVLLKNGAKLRALELDISRNIKHTRMLKTTQYNFNFAQDCPNLERLAIRSATIPPTLNFQQLSNISWLDLSSSRVPSAKLCALANLHKLRALILFDVWPLAAQLKTICALSELRVLDISVSNGIRGQYLAPAQLFQMIIEELPNLTHLDVSGTNLCELESDEVKRGEEPNFHIKGMLSREKRPLQFLGMLHRDWPEPNEPLRIFANEVASSASEAQLLTAARYYRDRPVVLVMLLDCFKELETYVHYKAILNITISAMNRNTHVEDIQTFGVQTLFNIIDFHEPTARLRSVILSTLIKAMRNFIDNHNITHNSFVLLKRFNLPYDLFDDCTSFMQLLADSLLLRRDAMVNLLNDITNNADDNYKEIFGKLGMIEIVLKYIESYPNKPIYSCILATAASILWNLTDEHAANCERFLNANGLDISMTLTHEFVQRDALVQNILGIICNTSEVRSLRDRLRKPDFLKFLMFLLELKAADKTTFEDVRFSITSILVNLMCDGHKAWHVRGYRYATILKCIERTVRTVCFSTPLSTSYNTVVPFLKFAREYKTPAIQEFAILALNNLTWTNKKKYCPMIEKENGIEVLNEVIKHPRPSRRVKDSAELIIMRIDKLKNRSAESAEASEVSCPTDDDIDLGDDDDDDDDDDDEYADYDDYDDYNTFENGDSDDDAATDADDDESVVDGITDSD